MSWHCSHCNAYKDPQSLDYETGLCVDCQEKGINYNERFIYHTTIHIEEVFDGNLDEWQERFFPFPSEYILKDKIGHILDFCTKMEWDVEISYGREI